MRKNKLINLWHHHKHIIVRTVITSLQKVSSTMLRVGKNPILLTWVECRPILPVRHAGEELIR